MANGGVTPRYYENIAHWLPESIDCVAPYDIPKILPEHLPTLDRWIPFNYFMSACVDEQTGVHTFVDDYQIERLWNAPQRYLERLKKAGCVCSPDFSMFTDTPVVLNLYNHYKKHWLAAYWQLSGIKVVPTICWGDARTFEWCFDGEPSNAPVAVSSVGTQQSEEKRAAFMLGYDAMLERLNPSAVLFWGNVPKEARGNIIPVETFSKALKRRCANASA